MKTTDIIRALRNSTTPAARLAAWQAIPIQRRLANLRNAWNYKKGLATARAFAVRSCGPEFSDPEAAQPLMWSGDRSPEVLEVWQGRDFLNHRGWYCDEYAETTMETLAVRLTRFPRLVFYAVAYSWDCGFSIRLEDWEEIERDDAEGAARSVVRAHDFITARMAEDEIEYQAKERRLQDIAENRETLKHLRGEIRELARELKRVCPMARQYPATAKAALASLRSLLAERAALIVKNTELAEA